MNVLLPKGQRPCCVWWKAQPEGYCVACAESEAAERRHQQRAATCQCSEHQAQRSPKPRLGAFLEVDVPELNDTTREVAVGEFL